MFISSWELCLCSFEFFDQLQISSFSEEIIFLVGLDGNVRSWVGNAGEDEAICQLVIVEERLVRVVDSAVLDQAGAGTASSSFARVWKVNASLLSGVEDVDIVITLYLLLTIWCDKGHVELSHHLNVSLSAKFGVEVVSHWRNASISRVLDGEAGGRWHATGEHSWSSASHTSLTLHVLNVGDETRSGEGASRSDA